MPRMTITLSEERQRAVKEDAARRGTMLAGTLHFVLSEALLVEYRRVLLRPAIAQRHGLSEADVDAVLESLVLNAGFREPPEAPDTSLAACEPPLVPVTKTSSR